MLIQSALEKSRYTPEDPLKSVYDLYGGCRLSDWIKYGFHFNIEILLNNEVLKFWVNNENTEKDLYFHCDLMKYLLMLNEILPDEEPIFNMNDCKVPRKGQTWYADDVSLDALISATLPVLITLTSKIVVIQHRFDQQSNLVPWILTKALYWSSELTARRYYYNITNELFNVIEPLMKPFCDTLNNFCIAALVPMSSKFSSEFFTKLVTPNMILKLRQLLNKDCSNDCPLIRELETMYEILDFEDILTKAMPSWGLLHEVCEQFENLETREALTTLKSLLDGDELCIQQMLQSKTIKHLEMFLTNRDPDIDGIKTFLFIFLEPDVRNKVCPYSFRSLIICLRNMLDYCTYVLEALIIENSELSDHLFNHVASILIDDIQGILNTMQVLYILNFNWYQLFDFVDVGPILSNQEIDNLYLSHNFSCMLGYYNFKCLDLTFKRMIETCPAACSLETKMNIVRYTFNSNDTAIYEIRRDHVLEDVRELFHKNPYTLSMDWQLRFKDEIGTGYGPTKEVYAILSQDLQKHDLNLWRVEERYSDDDKKSYTFFPDGLFPKNSTGSLDVQKTFEFFGKLMAKAVLDEYYLDIQMSEEFFNQLVPLVPSRYNHLRKDYYDIPKAFPLFETINNKFISMKRRMDEIMCERGLTDLKKKDIIQNLTFEDGSTFEDLFLNFTLPGSSTELIKDGQDVILTHFNLELYLKELCVQKDLTHPSKEFQAIRNGFDQILTGMLNIFTPSDFKTLITGDRLQTWALEDLNSYCRFDQGYTKDSKPVQYLFEVLTTLDEKNLTKFFKFTTGMTVMPTGGLRYLYPLLTISKIGSDNPDAYLPSSSTCFNVLFLPEYTSLEATRKKVLYAIEEGCDVFLIV